MIICKANDRKAANILIKNLNTDCWWNRYSWSSKTKEVSEEPLTGEELYGLFLHKVLFKHYEITVVMGYKEYFICEKTKNWENDNYDGYNSEITASFWESYKKGILTGKKEKLSKKQLIQTEENGKIK